MNSISTLPFPNDAATMRILARLDRYIDATDPRDDDDDYAAALARCLRD